MSIVTETPLAAASLDIRERRTWGQKVLWFLASLRPMDWFAFIVVFAIADRRLRPGSADPG
jgi:hypothetical protein